MMQRITMLTLGLLSCAAVQAAPNCQTPKGVWKSAFGYSIEIESVNARTKQISGSYVIGEGSGAKRSPLTGFWLTDGGEMPGADARPVIQISYALPEYGTVTAWTGTCLMVTNTPALSVVTHSARVKSPYAWDHVIAASDYFTAVP